MSNDEIALQRSESIQKIPEKYLNTLEDKQWDLVSVGVQQALERYKL